VGGRTYDDLTHWTYDELLGEVESLSEEILMYREIAPDAETRFRQGYAEAGDFALADVPERFIIEAGERQARILRECLQRVDVGTLVEDSGLYENALVSFASHAR
jgi:hypothetical protein